MDDIDALRERFLNHEFERKTFAVEAEQVAVFARTCGETAPRFTDPADPDFQAPPTFVSCFARGRNLPADFPLGNGIAMDGGKDVRPLAPIRAGVPLTGRSYVHDIYAKTGRSGRMVFVITRMELTDPDARPVAVADTRIVIREPMAT